MELSVRLQTVADLVTPGLRVADVGTDHGYVPIYLVESGKNPYAIAMDINRGPLKKAEMNIAKHELSSKIEVRFSDGLKNILPGQAESVIMAGMGGGLVIKIMEEAYAHKEFVHEWILQPQSELFKVREYLCQNGYRIVEEEMVLEEGKFYPMMKAVPGEAEEYSLADIYYGKLLLQKKNPILKKFLDREIRVKDGLLQRLSDTDSDSAKKRRAELQRDRDIIWEALQKWNS